MLFFYSCSPFKLWIVNCQLISRCKDTKNIWITPHFPTKKFIKCFFYMFSTQCDTIKHTIFQHITLLINIFIKMWGKMGRFSQYSLNTLPNSTFLPLPAPFLAPLPVPFLVPPACPVPCPSPPAHLPHIHKKSTPSRKCWSNKYTGLPTANL